MPLRQWERLWAVSSKSYFCGIFYFRKEKLVTVVFTGGTRPTKPSQRLPPAFRSVHTLGTRMGFQHCSVRRAHACRAQKGSLWIYLLLHRHWQLRSGLCIASAWVYSMSTQPLSRLKFRLGLKTFYSHGEMVIFFAPTYRCQIWTRTTEKSVVLYDSCACTQPRAQPSRASPV